MKKIYVSLLLTVFLFTAKSQTTHLVISQVYGGGGNAGAPYQNDYVEIFNPTAAPVTMTSWSIQYAATAGNFNLSVSVSGTIPAGKYFLVQLATGGAVGSALPAPDATNLAINMSAANGKVALVNNTTLLGALSCPYSNAAIIDLVGYGTANASEACVAAPAGTNTTAIFRMNNGCTDSDNNAADFTTAAPNPRNSSSAANLCAGSCTTPTQGASNLRYAGSTATTMSMLFTRGNGSGAVVFCRANNAITFTPVNGSTYASNATFAAGADLGGGTYAVHNASFRNVNGFTVSGLTTGTKYFFSVYEYNDPGKCYTATGLTDSFTVGATIFKPGDFVFVGWDNNIGGGEDKLYLMNMVDITKGTRFSIVNSRFETGAGANVRTNHWGGGGSDPWQDPDKQDFEYTGGTAIAKGSIIAMESNSAAGFTNFSINGGTAPATLFSAKSGTSNFLSTTDADQLYITQGKFTGYGTATVDRYDLFDGLVIHGITTKVAWIPLSSSVSVSNTGGPTRQSRIPPDILCINTEFAASTLNYAYYDRGVGQTGTKNTMLGRLKNLGNWFTGAGSTADDIIAGDGGFDTNPYAISAPGFTEGSWTGNSSTDWFDCNNWEGSHVPDSTLSATIYSVFTAGHNCIINVAASTNAAEYQSVAKAADLTLIGSLSLTGTGKEILKVDDTLTISNSGNLLFENTANAINDTLYLNGSFIDGTTTLGGFTPGQGTLSMEDSRFAAIPVSLNKPVISPVLGTYNLNINNSRSITLITPITVSNILGLNYGYINLQSPNGKLTLNSGATINSPVNNYGFTNEGWEKSFVNGQLNYTLGNISVNPFPVGKIGTDTVFAPFRLEKTIPNPATYTAEYFGVAYSDLTVDIGDLRKVSELEHWLISSPASSPNGDAKVSLSWRPASKVGDGNPAHDAEALDSLVVAHYFNDGFSTEWHIDGHDHNVMPKSIGSTISYGYVTTNFYTGGFTAIPFTLGGKSPYNVLPLQLIDFTATPVQKTILLNWMTREEKNILHYEVEKSTDGRNFSWLGTENAVNSLSLHNYRLVDQNPAPGWNYYRLKVTDDHYKISYSAVVRVWMASIGQVIVYPNPAQKEIKIILPPQSSTTELSIVNSAGQVVKQVRSNQLSLTINIETLSSGLYFIYIRNSQQAIVQRFIKQ